MREILWRSIELRNVESRIQDGKVLLDGEVLIAVLYSEEEETERLQWYETTVPLEMRDGLRGRGGGRHLQGEGNAGFHGT